jgi:hypothetical protein
MNLIEKALNIDPAIMGCNTDWVPHPRDVFVFVARVGKHDTNLSGQSIIKKDLNMQMFCRVWALARA